MESVLGRFSPYFLIENDLMHNNGKQIYFISIMKNRLDTKAKRGAIVKSLGIGSNKP